MEKSIDKATLSVLKEAEKTGIKKRTLNVISSGGLSRVRSVLPAFSFSC